MDCLEELKEKRKSSLVIVCTLGLASLFSPKLRPIWMTNIFEGMSFAKGEASWVFKCISYTFFGLATAAISFIVNLIKMIYYSIEISCRS